MQDCFYIRCIWFCTTSWRRCVYEASVAHRAALTGLPFSKALRDGVRPFKKVNSGPPKSSALTPGDTPLPALYLLSVCLRANSMKCLLPRSGATGVAFARS